MEVNSDLSEVDIIVNDLHEYLFTENEEFYEEWRKNNIYYEEGDTLANSISKLRRVHDVADENVLDFLFKTAESLNLHIDSGATKVADKINEFKERIRSGLRKLREKQYEQEHFVGRDKEIKKIMETFKFKSKYIGVCVCGLGGNGKTVLADYVCSKLEKSDWSCRKVVAREVKTVSQLARSILSAFERTDILTDNKDALQSAVCDCLITDTRFHKKTILFLDNIDDIHTEWDALVQFLENMITTIRNNKSIETRLLITSRKKLLTERGMYYVVYSLLQRQQSVSRFDNLCLEIELQPLSYDSAAQLVKSILPRDIQNKVTSNDIQKLIMSCGYNPLLIHTVCDTLRRGGKDMNEILGNVWSIITPVTGRYKPDACIEQTFLQLKKDSQVFLAQLAVFKTSQFDSTAAINVTKSYASDKTLTQSIDVDFCRLKVYHLIESHDSDNEMFSIHPLVYNFLKSKIRDQKRDFEQPYTEAVENFMRFTIKRMEEFDFIQQRSLDRVYNSFVRNEAHFQVLLEHLGEYPSNGSRSIKQNKVISEIADLIISDKQKIELMKRLKDKAKDCDEKLVAYFWEMEIIEAHLDNDDKSGLVKLNELGQSLMKIAPKHSASSLKPVIAMLMYLKGKWYFRYDKFSEGFQSLYPALCILESDMQSKHLMRDSSLKMTERLKDFRKLRSNVFNLIGCLYLRESGAGDDIAYHCFVEAFYSMISLKNRRFPVRSSNMVLYISNIGACIHYKGTEILNTDVANRHERAKVLFTESLKWSQNAIKLRQRMGQEKYSTYAFELQKRGKSFLELQQLNLQLQQPHSDLKLFYLALDDFKAALEIHLKIEKFPHSNITLVLHLIAKTGVMIGKEQISRGLTDAGESSLKYSKLFYDNIAHLVNDNGLEGYHRELVDIKQTHLWLLRHLNDDKLDYFTKVYKDCESGKKTSIWARNSTKVTKIDDRLKDLERFINKEEVYKIMDNTTKENVKEFIETVESKSDSLTCDELSTLLPVTFPDVGDDRSTTTGNNDKIFNMKESDEEVSTHKDKIDEMWTILKERGRGSDDFNLVLESIRLCKEGEVTAKPERQELKVAFKRCRTQSMPDDDSDQGECFVTKL